MLPEGVGMKMVLSIEWDWEFALWPRQGGSVASTGHWLGIQIREELTDEVTSLTLKISRTADWEVCLVATVSRNVVCQDLNTDFCKPHLPSSLSDP